MLVVAGLSLKNLHPRIWDAQSPYYLPELEAVMVSFAEFDRMPGRRRQALEHGLHAALGIPKHIKIYLDNGAFSFIRRGGEVPRPEYEAFVANAKPDWYAIPQDYIPTPRMAEAEQQRCFERTMEVNHQYHHDGYVPVAHVGPLLSRYLQALAEDDRLAAKRGIALGGIVPNLLRSPQALPYRDVIESLIQTRHMTTAKELHVFGIGGTATLHLAMLLGIDSVDSSGWRNRAARGLVQLPGRGDRMIADLGNWRGRAPSDAEWAVLRACPCPACQQFGLTGLQARGIDGFKSRATHNLWTLLRESAAVAERLADGTYAAWYGNHIDNSIYRPLIDFALQRRISR